MKERKGHRKKTENKRKNSFVEPKLTQMGSLKIITAASNTTAPQPTIVTGEVAVR